MREFLISENDAGQRLDKFNSKAVPMQPQGLLYKSIRLKRIKRNGRRTELSCRLEAGDRIQLYINDEFFEERRVDDAYLHVPDDLQVAYEDENIIVLDKPAGLLCHEDDSERIDTLANRLIAYLVRTGAYDPAAENSFVPALCNRIDRNTQGLVIAAKNAESQRILSQKIRDREIAKYYLCITYGIPSPRAGTIRNFLFKDERKNRVYVHETPVPGARTAVTRYRVLETRGNLALCEADLVTGRTHQIRVHFAHIGCPLLGDGKYGIGEVNRRFGIRHQSLQSYRLVFDFTSDAGRLSYLNHREVTCKKRLDLSGL